MKTLLTIILSCLFLNGYTQILNAIKYDTTNSGLPDNSVLGIDITNNDVLWVATWLNGLVSFDGTTWVKYDGSTANFPNSNIQDLIIDNNNNVFACGGFKVGKFNGSLWTDISTSSGIPKCFAKDASGTIWLADNQLRKYTGTVWSAPVTIPPTISFNPIKMAGDLSGNIWIANGAYIAKYDPAADTWTKYDTSAVSLFKYESSFSEVEITHDGKVIVEGTWNSYYFDGSKWGKLDSLSGLFMKNIYDITTRNNVSWIGMANGYGLASYNGTAWKKPTTNPSLLSIVGLRFDSQGNLWLGTFDGLYKIDHTNLAIEDFNVLDDIALLYPNPTRDVMNLNWISNTFTDGIANIFSPSGKLAASFPLQSSHNTLNLRNLLPGIYILNVKTNNGSYFQKIVLN